MIDDYLADMAISHAPRTLALQRTALGTFTRWLDRDPLTATKVDITAFLTRPGTKNNTRRSYRTTINGFFQWARDNGYTDANPLHGVGRPPADHGQPRPCPDHIVRHALATAPQTVVRMIVLGRFAGMRAAEIAAAHSDHYDGANIRITGKGNRTRTIPAHPDVAAIYAAADGWLFPSERGGPLSAKAVSERVSERLDGHWTCHTLRHAFGTQVYRDTGDLLVAQRLLGHTSPATTAIYCLPADATAAVAVNALALVG